MNRPAFWRVVLGAVVLGGACILAVGVLLGGRTGLGVPDRSQAQVPPESPAPDPVGSDPGVTVLETSDGVIVSYTLAATVVDARTGEPLPDVRVDVLGHPGDWAEVAVTDSQGRFDTVLDGTGLFPPGRFPSGAGPAVDVRLSVPGYGTRTVRDWPLPAGAEGQPPVRLDGRDHDDRAYDLGLRRVD